MKELTGEQKEALGRMIVEGFRKGDAEIVRGCFRRGADPDVTVQDGDSGARRPVLHWIAAHFNAAAAQVMFDNGADIEVRDVNGDTALMYAIRSSNASAVEFLMKNGADPVAQNYSKVVALDLARNLREDYESYKTTRNRIIKALTNKYEIAANKGDASAAPPEAPAAGIDAPADDAPQAIEIMKPIGLRSKKGNAGFKL